MSYGSLPALRVTIEANHLKPWIVLQHVIHSHLQEAIDLADKAGYDLEKQYAGRSIHCEIEGGVQDGTSWEDEPTVTLLFRRRGYSNPREE